MQNEGDSKNDCKTREIGSVREKKNKYAKDGEREWAKWKELLRVKGEKLGVQEGKKKKYIGIGKTNKQRERERERERANEMEY